MLAFHDFPPPVQLLLLAARLHLTAAEIEAIQTLTSMPLDWPRFLVLCDHHRLTPLVFESLSRLSLPSLPPAILAQLQQRATANAFETLRATHELSRIINAFHAAGFELAVLKGVPLSQSLFANPNARHVGDLDLLTTPHCLPEQIALLGELGYARTNPTSPLTPRRLASYISFWKDFTFASPGSGFELDLHWRLFNNRFHPANRILPAFSTDARWITVTIFGQPMRTLSAPDQLLYLAAHGALDSWTYLKTLADLAASLRTLSTAELDDALTHAQRLGLLSQLSGAIHLGNAWMATDVTHPLLLPDSQPSISHVRRRTSAMLLRQNFLPQRSFPSPARWLLLELHLVPGLRSMLEIIRRFFWRPRVWSKVNLPDRLFWLYPLLAVLLPPRPHSVDNEPAFPKTDPI